VQEAKEVPSVKVLDAAVAPTKKSFPPRGLLTVAGAVLAFLAACAWILIRQVWREIDPQDPGKQFAVEIAGTLRAEALRLAPAAAFMQMLARTRGRSDSSKNSLREQEEKSADASDLVRAARNGLG
jgi:hypothetical protein